MANPKLIRNIEASLVKYCKDIIAADALVGFKPFNFDTHAAINELPNVPLIGIAEVSVVNDQETYEVACMFVVCSTAEDTYLAKLNHAIDCLFDRLKPDETACQIVAETNGAILGNLKVQRGVSVFPVAVTKGRPLRTISVSFGSSLLVPP